MAISFIAGSNVSNDGTGVTTVAVTTHTLGDLICLGVYEDGGHTVSTVSGGGGSGWQRVAGPFTVAPADGVGILEIWVGTVTTIVTSTNITVTFSASVATDVVELDTAQFTAGLGSSTVWARDGSQQAGQSNTSATTIHYPSLTAAAAGELYFGKGTISTGTAGTTGSPASAVFLADPFADPYCYGLPTSAGAYQPVQNTSVAADSNTVGVLLTASLPAAAPARAPLVVGQAVRRAAYY